MPICRKKKKGTFSQHLLFDSTKEETVSFVFIFYFGSSRFTQDDTKKDRDDIALVRKTLLNLARRLGYRVVMSLANTKKAGSAALIRCVLVCTTVPPRCPRRRLLFVFQTKAGTPNTCSTSTGTSSSSSSSASAVCVRV